MGNLNLIDKAEEFIKIRNLIHIGAHEGQEMYYYDQYNNFEKIYFVEPIKECADLIRDKIKLNSKYQLFNCALGSEDKIEKFYVADGYDSGSSSLLAPRESDITFTKIIDIEVKQFTSLGLENIDTAVVDTQGYEIEVLKGFNEKIYDLNIAIVEFANYEGYINQPTYKKLNKFMKKKGFVPIDQVKRINKPIPTKKGGSFGDVLFLNSKLLNKKNIYFYRLKNYIINLIIFDLFVFTKKILKRYIKTILKK